MNPKLHTRIASLIAILSAVLLPIPAWAQQSAPAAPAQSMSGHGAMPGMGQMQGMSSGPALQEMMDAMQKMQKDMAAAPMTGDADHDFVNMMIPHHQGAIDMARAELQHGKDPMLRRLAQSIIAAQEKEIMEMSQWQTKHPGS
jgi:uncharacterized protein (DUF305 family)